MLELDRATHTYSNRLPSVTTILKSVGLIDTAFYTEEGRIRGSYVHQACEYLDLGCLDESTIDPQIAGYLEAYKRWRQFSGVEFEWIEQPLSDKAHLFAGTPDRVLISRPRKLVDLKTGAFQRWHAIQSAAYVSCLDDPWSYQRLGLYLQDNGSFMCKEFPKTDYALDLAIWQSALNLYYWKERR